MAKGHGITSKIWKLLFQKEPYEGGRNGTRVRKMTRSEALRLFRERFKQQ